MRSNYCLKIEAKELDIFSILDKQFLHISQCSTNNILMMLHVIAFFQVKIRKLWFVSSRFHFIFWTWQISWKLPTFWHKYAFYKNKIANKLVSLYMKDCDWHWKSLKQTWILINFYLQALINQLYLLLTFLV